MQCKYLVSLSQISFVKTWNTLLCISIQYHFAFIKSICSYKYPALCFSQWLSFLILFSEDLYSSSYHLSNTLLFSIIIYFLLTIQYLFITFANTFLICRKSHENALLKIECLPSILKNLIMILCHLSLPFIYCASALVNT